MDWKAASGSLKEVSCRKALVVLDDQGLIELPMSDVTIKYRCSALVNSPSLGFHLCFSLNIPMVVILG